jgi:hypothetical protein
MYPVTSASRFSDIADVLDFLLGQRSGEEQLSPTFVTLDRLCTSGYLVHNSVFLHKIIFKLVIQPGRFVRKFSEAPG